MLLSLMAQAAPQRGRGIYNKSIYFSISLTFFIFLVLFVGWRHEIGVDWEAYQNQTQLFSSGLFALLLLEDPGYQLFNFIGKAFGGGVYTTNILSSLVFFSGLFYFSARHTKLFRALAVSYPYLIVFVAMGYTRQSAAIGLLLFCLTFCFQKRFLASVLFALIASSFHKSAILGLLFPLFTFGFSWLFLMVSGSFLCFLFLVFLLSPLGNIYFERYFESGLSSGGSYFRIGVQLCAAIIFLTNTNFFRRKGEAVYDFCLYSSYISIMLFISVFLLSGATFLDRIALYFFPLQIIIFSDIPNIYKLRVNGINLVPIFFLFYGAFFLGLYLSFGNYVEFWLPYQTILTTWM